jgi:hypothetical protein
MRVLVRNLKTGRYLKAVGDWTDRAEEAHDFQRTYNAIESRAWGQEDVELVFSFGEKQYDLSIPLGQAVPPRATGASRKIKPTGNTNPRRSETPFRSPPDKPQNEQRS